MQISIKMSEEINPESLSDGPAPGATLSGTESDDEGSDNDENEDMGNDNAGTPILIVHHNRLDIRVIIRGNIDFYRAIVGILKNMPIPNRSIIDWWESVYPTNSTSKLRDLIIKVFETDNNAYIYDFLNKIRSLPASMRPNNENLRDYIISGAASIGRLKTIQSLLTNVPQLPSNPLNRHIKTAMEYAAVRGHADVVKYLLETYQSFQDVSNACALAAEIGSIELVELIYNRNPHCFEENGYPLASWEAVINRDYVVVFEWLVTTLNVLQEGGLLFSDPLNRVLHRCPKILEWLLRNIDEYKRPIDRKILSIFENALSNGNLETVGVMMDYFKDSLSFDVYRMFLFFKSPAATDIFQLIIKNGFDIMCNKVSFSLACISGHYEIAKFILDVRPDISENVDNWREILEKTNSFKIITWICSIKENIEFDRNLIIENAFMVRNLDIVKWVLSIYPDTNLPQNMFSLSINRPVSADNPIPIIAWMLETFPNIEIDDRSLTTICRRNLLDISKLVAPVLEKRGYDMYELFRMACVNGSLDIAMFIYSVYDTVDVRQSNDKLFRDVCDYGILKIVNWLITLFPNDYSIEFNDLTHFRAKVAIGVVNIEEIAPNDTCIICQDRNINARTQCNHMFCSQCIETLCNSNNNAANCPMCRAPIGITFFKMAENSLNFE